MRTQRDSLSSTNGSMRCSLFLNLSSWYDTVFCPKFELSNAYLMRLSNTVVSTTLYGKITEKRANLQQTVGHQQAGIERNYLFSFESACFLIPIVFWLDSANKCFSSWFV